MSENLVFIGKIIEINDIPNADYIVSATVVCGPGGKWKGVVQKDQFHVGDECIVYLPDSMLVPAEEYLFMKAKGWRVRMQRFRGVPSEVLIMPKPNDMIKYAIGTDVTLEMGVKKYCKPVPENLQGQILGGFPGFIPKTDELNYQMHRQLPDVLVGKPYYVTIKYDGCSCTCYKKDGHFGVCSRNLELKDMETNGLWNLARRYNLPEEIPENIAIQFEVCGPKIQGNPLKLNQLECFGFSAYDIKEHKYLEFEVVVGLFKYLKFPMAQVIEIGDCFSLDGLEERGKGLYDSGQEREGVVIRSQTNHFGDHPISFKVINLDYE